MDANTKLEVIYYEMIKMEERITEKAQTILEARDAVESTLARFEILSESLIEKLEGLKNEKTN
ncbi:MAG: hypothetical protein OIF32_02365 [Campylobacterales bacterium]|nr:hypothetical protein [Campylobacterales bacterium]